MNKISLFGIALLFPGFVNATLITSLTAPDSVNQLVKNAGNTVSHTYFSTYTDGSGNVQSSVVGTSYTSLFNSLLNDLGPLGVGESYQINSASLTAGSTSNDYTIASSAYVMTAAFNAATLTYNNCGANPNNGCEIGTDTLPSVADVGLVNASTGSTSWDLTTEVANALVSSTDFNFFFPSAGGTGANTYTPASYVSWAINASIVSESIPEPSIMSLFGLAGISLAGIGFARRKRMS